MSFLRNEFTFENTKTRKQKKKEKKNGEAEANENKKKMNAAKKNLIKKKIHLCISVMFLANVAEMKMKKRKKKSDGKKCAISNVSRLSEIACRIRCDSKWQQKTSSFFLQFTLYSLHTNGIIHTLNGQSHEQKKKTEIFFMHKKSTTHTHIF